MNDPKSEDRILGLDRQELITELKTIDPDDHYYAITLLGSDEGKIQWSTQTEWVGWVGGKPGREIRKGSLVKPEYMAEHWNKVGQGCLVVNSRRGLFIFLRLGGNALVKKAIAETHLQNIIEENETAYDGPHGFVSATDLPAHAFKRAPRPKHRMQIIKRDSYTKCKICGRRPDNYTDIELHVHHIRPWEKGGLTEDGNLLTICDTCHDGLEPHADYSLFALLDPGAAIPNIAKRNREFAKGVSNYRKAAVLMFAAVDAVGELDEADV